MPQYAILRFSKHKGGSCRALEAHHERQKEKYASNPDVDTSRSKYNFHIIRPTRYYRLEVDRRIKAAGCKTRRDSTRFVDTLITASPEFFKGKRIDEINTFFKTAVDFIADKIGNNNIFSAMVHMDEKTPHLHLCFTPITEDNRLSAKDILGNRARLSKWQDEFYAHMVKAYPDLERGELSRETGRKHIPTRIFKQAVHLTQQASRIQKELSDINPINAKKKREHVIELLHKWFPAMEDFETQIKKYQRTINFLEKERLEFAQGVKEGNDHRFITQMEINKLQSEIKLLRRFISSLPEDVQRELQKKQQQNRNERGNR